MGPILRRARSPMALRANCHRILVLREGRVTAIYEAAEATQERIMASATLAEEDV
jgi:ABC-type sugar transport system ATPase subunit